jgi:hypothetical protein
MHEYRVEYDFCEMSRFNRLLRTNLCENARGVHGQAAKGRVGSLRNSSCTTGSCNDVTSIHCDQTALTCYASSRSLKSVASSDCDRRSVATCLSGNGSNASRSNDCRPDRICRCHDMIPRRARGRAPAPSMRAATSTAFPSPHPEVPYFQHFAVVLATLSWLARCANR